MQKLSESQIIIAIEKSQYIVIDAAIVKLYPKINRAITDRKVFVLEQPEAQKKGSDYLRALNFFLNHQITREDYILAIGGGATSDFAGFVASTIKRGINWEVIPTTLLSMIDACIGGKVGINSEHGKNTIGQFHPPREIYFCQDFLTTLPSEHYQSGLGELSKYLFLSSQVYAEFLKSEKLSENLIFECARYKQSIVDTDLKDHGQRKLLNLGHTFGHAFEKAAHIPHGIAVGLGLECMIALYKPDLLPELKRLQQLLSLNLPDKLEVVWQDFEQYLRQDKKINSKGYIDIIVPLKLGESEIKSVELTEMIKNFKENEFNKRFFQ